MNRRLSRRVFLGRATTLTVCAFLSPHIKAADIGVSSKTTDKPNSVFNGVRIGCITYSYRGGIHTAEDTLKALIQDGLSEVELMDGPIVSYAGLNRGGRPRNNTSNPPAKPTDEQLEAQLAKCQLLRKMYNDAGVHIHIHKIPFAMSSSLS